MSVTQIKNRFTGAVVFEAEVDGETESIRLGLELQLALKNNANLAGANLAHADLARANLAGPNLAVAKGINKYLTTPLYLLFDQPGKIRAYKVVLENGEGIYSRSQGYTPIVYRVGETYKVENASTNEQEHCAAGISLATLDWCIKEWELGRRIMVAEFSRKDIACIPIGSDGKFRVHSCKIVGEKDLKELGLVKDEVDGDHE
jgi:hypothetical protein